MRGDQRPAQLGRQGGAVLDHQDPRVHYRAPTRKGNSGSPVFNSDWDLLALHHYGHEKVAKLNGAGGFYPANEGIYVKAIFDEIARFFAGRATQSVAPAPQAGAAGAPADDPTAPVED